MNPNPNCDKECRFQYSNSQTTMAYYPPIFDKNGNNINPDRNITIEDVTCSTCGGRWLYSTQNGITEYR